MERFETLSRFVIGRAHAAFTEEASGRAIGGIFGSGPQDIEIFLGIHWVNSTLFYDSEGA